MRISYTNQYRRSSDGTLAVQLRIEATRGVLSKGLTISVAAEAESMDQGLYRLLEGPIATAEERCVYHHFMIKVSYLVFVLYVDHINPQNGMLNLTGLFASWTKPFDPDELNAVVQAARERLAPGASLGGFSGLGA
jgi:hypothetical protein